MNIHKIIIVFISLLLITACSKTDLYEYPDSESSDTEIRNFSLLNETGQSVGTNVMIDKESATIIVKVANGTDISRLVPRTTVSEGVIVEPKMGVYTDFSTTKIYTLIAGDRSTKTEWTIYVSQ